MVHRSAGSVSRRAERWARSSTPCILLWEHDPRIPPGGKDRRSDIPQITLEEADALRQALGQSLIMAMSSPWGTPVQSKDIHPRRISAAPAFREADAGTDSNVCRHWLEFAKSAPLDSTGADVYADRGGSLIPEVASVAAAVGAELSDVHISEPSLENLFLHHTGRSLRD